MTPEEREGVIGTILGSPWGIYRAEVCQVCGEISRYWGSAAALGNHFNEEGEFVAVRHRHGDDGVEGAINYGSTERARAGALLRDRSRRFCEVCQGTVERHSAERVGGRWLCATCVSEFLAGDDEPVAWLRDFVRRRYLEMCDDEVLARWGATGRAQGKT